MILCCVVIFFSSWMKSKKRKMQRESRKPGVKRTQKMHDLNQMIDIKLCFLNVDRDQPVLKFLGSSQTKFSIFHFVLIRRQWEKW
mmetsp:Transcript_4223/g.4347  ORF Transcript_4223/g.4347 Transcript_4223/m.4347 type:complete len:85 (-) Transcript_4223:3-257(-)